MKTGMLVLIFFFALLPILAQEPEKPPSLAAASAKQVIQELVAGQFDKVEAQYDARLAAGLPPGRLAAGWASLIQQTGPFDSVLQTKTSSSQGVNFVVLVCRFQKAIIDAEIGFDPDGKIAGLIFRPHQEVQAPWAWPPYAKVDTFTDQPLTVVNGKFELPGTLTLPKGDGPFPGVVLVQGSGPHDEDETIGANKPFKDLAWGLASRGIAVLRYIKRTLKYGAKSSDDPAKLTVEDETVSDARAAVALFAKQPKIDLPRVFLLGHSLGAYLAPRISTGDAQIAGIVMMAANTLPIEGLIVNQIRYIDSANGTPAAEAQKQIAAAEETAKEVENPDLKPGDTVTVLGASIPASYWLDLRGYHPTSVASLLRIPILILQGGRDFQVTPENFDEWRSALAGHKNVTLKLYPGLNHLFMAGTGPSMPEEYNKPGHVAAEVITDIAAWISAAPSSAKPAK